MTKEELANKLNDMITNAYEIHEHGISDSVVQVAVEMAQKCASTKELMSLWATVWLHISNPPQQKLKLKVDDEHTKVVWECIKKCKKEVDSWPKWKRGEDT